MQNLPPVLAEYFEAANAHDVDALVGCFTSDAQVKDEGKTHSGHENIALWNHSVNDKYKCKNIAKSWVQTPGGANVKVEVSGTFLGGPIELTFHFILQDGKISWLEIV